MLELILGSKYYIIEQKHQWSSGIKLVDSMDIVMLLTLQSCSFSFTNVSFFKIRNTSFTVHCFCSMDDFCRRDSSALVTVNGINDIYDFSSNFIVDLYTVGLNTLDQLSVLGFAVSTWHPM